MFRRFLMAAIVAGIATLAGPSTSEAAFTLRLTQGATVVTVLDGGAGDSNPVLGAITYIGPVGVFTINVSTGLSKPAIGPAAMDLNSVNSSTAAGTLTIELTDTDFVGPSPGHTFNVGGTSQGTAVFEAGRSDLNAPFALSDSTGALAFGAGAFSGSAGLGSGIGNPYSLTIRADITHGSGTRTSSFNAELTPVPAPAGLILAATALPFVGLLRRRLRKPEATTTA
jgi:hypothetical protein